MAHEMLKMGLRLIPGVYQAETGARLALSKKAFVAYGLGAAVLSYGVQGMFHPFGTEMAIDQQEGVITGFYNLEQTEFAGTKVQTDTTTTIHASAFGHQIPGAYVQKEVPAEIDVNIGQKQSKVTYQYNKATGWTTVTVPEKALTYTLSAPPEKLTDNAVKNGPVAMPTDILGQVVQQFTDKGPGSYRDDISTNLYKIDMYSNYDAAYKCMPLAWKVFGAERFKQGNTKMLVGLSSILRQSGVTLDMDKVKIQLPKSIAVPPNKYSQALHRLDGNENVALSSSVGQCKITPAAEAQAKQLTEQQ